MSFHNYTNPAFCQKSEFYLTSPNHKTPQPHQQHQQILHHQQFDYEQQKRRKIQRSMSARSFQKTSSMRKINALNRSQQFLEKQQQQQQQGSINPFDATNRSGSGRYALVPVEELNSARKDHYAVIPGPTSDDCNQESVVHRNYHRERFTKSQDNIDQCSHISIRDDKPHSFHEELDTFKSLPPILPPDDQPKLKSAFSSDFGKKQIVLLDTKNNQRYAVVPTEEDEDIVDENHEIIQMHNGRAHRYAVIPTEGDDEEENEEEETCLSNSDLNQSITHHQQPLHSSTPQKFYYDNYNSSYPNTPIKNPIATRKLLELLSTPIKIPNHRISITPPSATAVRPKVLRRCQSQQQQIYVSNQQINRHELTPQRLQYEQTNGQANYSDALVSIQNRHHQQKVAQVPPRVAAQSNQMNNNNDSLNKSFDNSYPQKIANATATLGIVSLMLILGSALNAGLCIYLIAHTGRSFYLEFSLAAAFSGVGLGVLGFRSRHCEWLPNRSYISGYILVTVFCLFKCCGLLVLLALDPFPGMPLHDVTTGIILGLSTFTIFFIGLGVIGTYWCYSPPPDNRVNVY